MRCRSILLPLFCLPFIVPESALIRAVELGPHPLELAAWTPEEKDAQRVAGRAGRLCSQPGRDARRWRHTLPGGRVLRPAVQ